MTTALLQYLRELKENNHKEWFEIHKSRFQNLDKELKTDVSEITALLNLHDTIEKSKIFRIYRDVRFSKDKTPYKTQRSVNWMRAGAHRRGSYYMRISPGESLVGVGFFKPEKDDLFRIRKELELDAQELRDIIEKPLFYKTWGTFKGETLKTAPRDFDKDHPDIDLIRYKSFYFMKSFTDKELLSPDFKDQINTCFKIARPYLDYMTDVLTTDLNGESIL